MLPPHVIPRMIRAYACEGVPDDGSLRRNRPLPHTGWEGSGRPRRYDPVRDQTPVVEDLLSDVRGTLQAMRFYSVETGESSLSFDRGAASNRRRSESACRSS